MPFDSIMVVGVNTRPVVKSAKALGLKTIAVDCFGDVDLLERADIVFSMRSERPKSSKRSTLFQLSLQALEAHEVDAILLTSGTEHNPQLIEELGKRAKIIGNNNTTQLEICKNKEKLFRIADKLDISYPLTHRVRTRDEALEAAGDVGYPVVLKPAFGGGGIGIRLAKSPEEVNRFFKRVLSAGDGESLYVQQYIRGIDASASVLSSGDEAKCLTVNEQIIGDKRLGAPGPFGYCGNIVPLKAEKKLTEKIAKYAETLCSEIGLLGSNGVDFVLSGNNPHLMEINPRFQGTIDCIEKLLRINLVEEHIRACGGGLCSYKRPVGYSVKLIVYAKENVKIPGLRAFPGIVDIPRKDSIVKRGKPICSVLMFGGRRENVIGDAYATAEKIYSV